MFTHKSSAINKKLFFTLLPAALFVFTLPFGAGAQTSNQPALLTFGPWAACEAGILPAASWYCLGVAPGSETYQLIIPHDGGVAVAYHYSVTATLVSGETRTLSGVVERGPEESGYTFTILNFGGRLKAWSFTIQNLGVVSVKVKESRPS